MKLMERAQATLDEMTQEDREIWVKTSGISWGQYLRAKKTQKAVIVTPT